MGRTRSKQYLIVSAIGIIGTIVGFESAVGHGAMHNPTRSAFMQDNGVPAEYSDLLNPLSATSEHLRSGALLYEENCASCHGSSGDGLSEAAVDLEPAPPAINNMYRMPMAGMMSGGDDTHLMHGVEHHHPGLTHAEAMGGMNIDAYMFWTIAEGGEAFGSSMPAFKEMLDETARWQLLLFVANGFSTTPP